MNSGILDEVFLSPVAAHAASLQIAQTQTILKVAVAQDIMASVAAGTFTSSYDVTGKASQDVQYVLAILNQAGYSAHMSAENLIVSW